MGVGFWLDGRDSGTLSHSCLDVLSLVTIGVGNGLDLVIPGLSEMYTQFVFMKNHFSSSYALKLACKSSHS